MKKYQNTHWLFVTDYGIIWAEKQSGDRPRGKEKTNDEDDKNGEGQGGATEAPREDQGRARAERREGARPHQQARRRQ